MTDLIRAPWTPEQVATLNRFQREGGMHPFTCGAPHASPPNLVARSDGWHCPGTYRTTCDYQQDWAHAFMADPDTWPTPFADLRQATATGTCIHPDGYDGECPCPTGCACCQVAARTTPDNPLRDQLAAAIESEIYEYRERTMFWEETIGVTQEIARLATRGAMEAIERHLDTGEEQAWCKTCRRIWEGRGHRCEDGADATAQRLLDQRQELAAERYAWQERALRAERALAALQPPAPGNGPSVAEAAADDRVWPLQKGGE